MSEIVLWSDSNETSSLKSAIPLTFLCSKSWKWSVQSCQFLQMSGPGGTFASDCRHLTLVGKTLRHKTPRVNYKQSTAVEIASLFFENIQFSLDVFTNYTKL